jgi:hypothetical protein
LTEQELQGYWFNPAKLVFLQWAISEISTIMPVYLKGTINGTPFIFWTDEEIEVEIEFEDVFTLGEASIALLTVSFDIASLFDPAKGGIDLSNAADGNENGIIEIYPGDPDGNNDLADLLWNRLEDIIEAFEDSMDD